MNWNWTRSRQRGSDEERELKTKIKGYVFGRLLTIVVILGAILIWLFELLWGSVILLVALAFIRSKYTNYTKPFTAKLVLDSFGSKKKIRCLRKGLNWIAPGETFGQTIDLKTEIKGVEEETYTTKVGKILAKYVYSMNPDRTSDEALITYASFEPDAIKQAARALFSMTLSDYFRNKIDDEDILHKSEINKKLFGERDSLVNPLTEIVQAFAKRHGVIVKEVRLEDVDFDEEVQRARDTVSKAKSVREAVEMLMEAKDGKPGMEKEKAEKYAAMMNIPSLKENTINLNVTGLDKLEHANVVFPGNLGDDDKKKGGKK